MDVPKYTQQQLDNAVRESAQQTSQQIANRFNSQILDMKAGAKLSNDSLNLLSNMLFKTSTEKGKKRKIAEIQVQTTNSGVVTVSNIEVHNERKIKEIY